MILSRWCQKQLDGLILSALSIECDDNENLFALSDFG